MREEEEEGQDCADRERQPDVGDEVAVGHEGDSEEEVSRLGVFLAVAEGGEPYQTEKDRDENRSERDAPEVEACHRGLSVSAEAKEEGASQLLALAALELATNRLQDETAAFALFTVDVLDQ